MRMPIRLPWASAKGVSSCTALGRKAGAGSNSSSSERSVGEPGGGDSHQSNCSMPYDFWAVHVPCLPRVVEGATPIVAMFRTECLRRASVHGTLKIADLHR